MCGILGIIGTHNRDSFPLLRDKICHRGPDSKGEYYDFNLSLGSTRLAILDSQNGEQPLISEDKTHVIIFNGEIYNHTELRKSLSKKFTFKSNSDTETLLNGYIEYGEGILDRINGIFSFAIYNKVTNDLFIARDPFGIKPLYYFQNDTNFIFSSEIKSLKDFSFVNKSPSYSSFLNYITLLYSPGENSPLENIKRLSPGHFIKINTQNLKEFSIKRYYTLPVLNHTGTIESESKIEKRLEEHLFKAIERQMRSDVPVGFFLSGGLDSSSLVALTKAIYPNRNLDCFTTNIGEEKTIEGFHNDIHYARMVSRYLNVNLEEIKIETSILQDFDFMIYHLDEPLSDPAALHTYYIAKRAKELGYKVLISGTGGDEIFSGYRRHQAMQMEKFYPYLPSFVIHSFQKSLSILKVDHPFRKRGEKLFKQANATKFDRMVAYFFWLEINKAKDLFSPAIKEIIKAYHPEEYFYNLLSQLPKELDNLNRILYLDMNSYLPDNNLNYTDKMSMAAGVEVRVPFLDKELVEFAMQLPPELKMKGFSTKYLLKKVMKNYLPEAIINRPKTGFGAPVRKWITNDLVGKINSELSFEKINKRGIFDANRVWQLINDNKSGKIDASYSIWALLAIESWMRQFVDE